MKMLPQLKQTFQLDEKSLIQNGMVTAHGGKIHFNQEDELIIKKALKWKERYGGDFTVLMVGGITWGIEKRMFVCKDHVTEGLKVIYTPHIKKITDKERGLCRFCEEKAQFKLFHFISLSKQVKGEKIQE
ncbi:hypothetical protein [Ammoniphilus sp. 3BR4]|uniref:hypothetical protein n=1 Tax=Ammoniphilus sp. 3BR4 TaxID=3158265 RepID=UPI003466289E